jgi:hypothetical protein
LQSILSVETFKICFRELLVLLVSFQVKAPVLFLLGAQDLRVPISNGLQVKAYCFVLFISVFLKGKTKITFTGLSSFFLLLVIFF